MLKLDFDLCQHVGRKAQMAGDKGFERFFISDIEVCGVFPCIERYARHGRGEIHFSGVNRHQVVDAVNLSDIVYFNESYAAVFNYASTRLNDERWFAGLLQGLY